MVRLEEITPDNWRIELKVAKRLYENLGFTIVAIDEDEIIM